MDEDAATTPQADDKLSATVYRQLKQMAHRQLQREHGHYTLSTTVLVHEAWMQMRDHHGWRDREHFYRYAATTMRHILVDEARRRRADKRGSGAIKLALATGDAVVDDAAEDILGLDRALGKLAAEDPRLAEVVELRFFAGLSVVDTARTLAVTERTVIRDWRVARLLIHRELERGDAA